MISKSMYKTLAAKHGTPLYVYDLDYLEERASDLLNLCQSRGYILRYALKANPHPEIIKLFDELGLAFDASSDYESRHTQNLGVEASKISLNSQQPPINLKKILGDGVKFTATSFYQLELLAKSGWNGKVAVRINPGLGSGHNMRTTTGGNTSSFGVWHEYIPKIVEHQKRAGFFINRICIHIGSGGDPKIWQDAISRALEIVKLMPSVDILNMGGGFKVARMPGEPEADMPKILQIFEKSIKTFQKQTGRRLQLEIEPGTWLVANGGILLSTIVDIVDTGKSGYTFLKLNTGMNDLLRPAMYGAQHSIEVLNGAKAKQEYVVVGHNCETGDILTPAPGDPEKIKPRILNRAEIDDLVAIGGTGAYGASMRAIGYNSFPSAKEVCFKT